MKLPSKPLLFVMSIAAMLTIFISQRRIPTGLFTPALTSKDVSFHASLAPEIRGAINEARSAEKYFLIPVWNGYDEQIATESSLPKLPSLDGTQVSILGPHATRADTKDEQQTYLERIIRALFAAICLIGSTFFIRSMALSMRLLTGTLLFGWISIFISLFTNLTGQTMAAISAPVFFVSAVVLFFKLKKSFRIKSFLPMLFSLALLLPTVLSFLFLPLFGPDARTMWFYRYKFFYFYGFNLDMILNHMGAWAQRDYSWLLSAPMSLTSLFEQKYFGGWNENAAFSLLLFIYVSIVELWIRAGSRLHLSIRTALAVVAAGVFPSYTYNGYMDFFWMSPFALFLFAYYDSRSAHLEHKQPIFSETEAWILLCFAVSVKNEAAAFFIVFALFELWRNGRNSMSAFIKTAFGSLFFFALALLPLTLQKLSLKAVGIGDQYNLLHTISHSSLYSAIKKFEEAHRFLIKNIVFSRPQYIAAGVALIIFICFKKKWRTLRQGFALVYAFSLAPLLIYAYTPYDLGWHLETSAYRVFMFWSVFACAAWMHLLNKELKT